MLVILIVEKVGVLYFINVLEMIFEGVNLFIVGIVLVFLVLNVYLFDLGIKFELFICNILFLFIFYLYGNICLSFIGSCSVNVILSLVKFNLFIEILM